MIDGNPNALHRRTARVGAGVGVGPKIHVREKKKKRQQTTDIGIDTAWQTNEPAHTRIIIGATTKKK